MSQHAKLPLALSCALNLQLIQSECKAFLSQMSFEEVSYWTKSEVWDLCHWLWQRSLCHQETLDSQLQLNKLAHKYYCTIYVHHSIVLRELQTSLFQFRNMLETEDSCRSECVSSLVFFKSWEFTSFTAGSYFCDTRSWSFASSSNMHQHLVLKCHLPIRVLKPDTTGPCGLGLW